MSTSPNPAAPRIARRRLDGVLLLDKPAGMSSNGALQQAKRLFRAEKAGHTGTLDPLATGLLPICFGEATKFAQALLHGDKTYEATVRLGITTRSGDADGEETSRAEVAASQGDVLQVLERLIGPQVQVPPLYSALKHKGRPLYDYARAGIDIPRQPRPIEIHELELLACSLPDVVIRVRCSKGTYIRVLAEDIGRALGCGAYLAHLRRTASGDLSLTGAESFDVLASKSESQRDALLLPCDALLQALPCVELASGEATRLQQGQPVRMSTAAPVRPDGPLRAYRGSTFLGVVEAVDGQLSARRLMTQQASSGEMLVA